MNTLNRDMTLGFYNESGLFTIPATQHDTGRTLTISLVNNGEEYQIPETVTAHIKLLKPDGYQVNNICTIENNTIIIPLSAQMLAVPGTAQCELYLTDGESKLTTSRFNLFITESVHDDSQIESTYECDYLDELLSRARLSIENAEAIEATIQANEEVRIASEEERNANEKIRITAENYRSSEFQKMQSELADATQNAANAAESANTAATAANTAAENANTAAKNANVTGENLQNALDTHQFIYQEDIGVAGGVAGLDENSKLSASQLYEATTTTKGITQLNDSVSDNSVTTAATANSVKQAYDKVLSVESSLASVAVSGNYHDLSNTPAIPTKTSELANDSGFLTETASTNNIIDDLDAINAVTEEGIIAGALALKDVNNKFAGCWISFTDADGTPTTEPYIHWYEEVTEEETTESEVSK